NESDEISFLHQHLVEIKMARVPCVLYYLRAGAAVLEYHHGILLRCVEVRRLKEKTIQLHALVVPESETLLRDNPEFADLLYQLVVPFQYFPGHVPSRSIERSPLRVCGVAVMIDVKLVVV